MKRLLAATSALCLLAALTFPQSTSGVFMPGQTGITGFGMPNGSASAPPYSFASHPTAGGYWDSTGTGYTIWKGEDLAGTNAAGGNVEIDGGSGTGTGVGGDFLVSVTPPASGSGSTPNTLQNAMKIKGDNTGNFFIGGIQVTNPGGAPGGASSVFGAWAKSGISNLAGGDLNIAGGNGTGTGAGGNVNIRVYPKAAGSGSALNAASTVITANGNTGDITLSPATPGGGSAGYVFLTPRAFSTLGTPGNNAIVMCSDCASPSNPCTGSSTGALAVRQNGAWKCF